NYYSRVVADVNNGLVPVLSASTTVARLIGSTPLPSAEYPHIVVDLYIPDPDGIATGKALDPAVYPDGWIQGKTYLGSFLVDGPQDLAPGAGAFEFEISSLNIT